MTYPGSGLYPSSGLFPGGGGGVLPIGDYSGNPSGFDESGWWGSVDNRRPDALRWIAVDLLTGRIVCDLPGIVSQDPTRRTLGRYESMTVKLVVNSVTSPDWFIATRPFGSALIAYRGQPGSEVIYWGGVVLARSRALGSNLVSLTLATPECYFDRRFTGAYTTDPLGIGAKKSQNQVVTDLVNQFVVATSGMPFTVQTVGVGTVPTVFEEFNDYDDKTVYSTLTTLMALLNGPEWTAHWSWNQTTNLIRPVLYVGNRIGTVTPPGLAPAAFFDSANLIGASVVESYASGQGANVVVATSSGQGLARPTATSPAVPAYRGRPRVEHRYQPVTSIRDVLTLQQHADHGWALLNDGTTTVTLKATTTLGPQYGVDWQLGDDAGFELTGDVFPGGYTGVGRIIGYEADDIYTSPVLYAPPVN